MSHDGMNYGIVAIYEHLGKTVYAQSQIEEEQQMLVDNVKSIPIVAMPEYIGFSKPKTRAQRRKEQRQKQKKGGRK